MYSLQSLFFGLYEKCYKFQGALCSSRKYLQVYAPQERLTEIPRGGEGFQKHNMLIKGKYDVKLEFPEVLGVQTKRLSFGQIWKFSGTTD